MDAYNKRATCVMRAVEPRSFDFVLGDLVTDNIWRELDVSSIVPKGAKAIIVSFNAAAVETDKCAHLARVGDEESICVIYIETFVSTIPSFAEGIIGLTPARKIGYKISDATWLIVNIVIKGWFF